MTKRWYLMNSKAPTCADSDAGQGLTEQRQKSADPSGIKVKAEDAIAHVHKRFNDIATGIKLP